MTALAITQALDLIERTPARSVFASRPGVVVATRFHLGRAVAFRRTPAGVRAELWDNQTRGEPMPLGPASAERAGRLIDRRP